MKYKLLATAALAAIIYSCASKSNAPTAEIKKEEPVPVAAETAPTVASGPAMMTPELLEGKSLYENNCAGCHRLYKSNEFTTEEWGPIVKRMAKKSDLNEIQEKKIYNYITMK